MSCTFCPRVIVTDRDLVLMKACEDVFPQSNHLLRRWHIFNDITKHCRKRIKSDKTWGSSSNVEEISRISDTECIYASVCRPSIFIVQRSSCFWVSLQYLVGEVSRQICIIVDRQKYQFWKFNNK